MVIGIDNLDKETNIRTESGLNKTKAEIIYDITLAIINSGQAIHDNAIRYANSTYQHLVNAEIIYEIDNSTN